MPRKNEGHTLDPNIDRCLVFKDLIDAIKNSDMERIDRYRTHWHDLRIHFDDCNACKGIGNDLNNGFRITLILWLSTPPTQTPIKWDELSEPSFIKDSREQQIELVNELWNLWKEGIIVTPLKCSLNKMNKMMKTLWIDSAKKLFNEFHDKRSEIFKSTESEQTRLDIVSGYGSFIDKMLISQDCEIAEAAVLIGIEDNLPVFNLPDKTKITLAEMVKALLYRTEIEENLLSLIAGCISFYLPARDLILPNIKADVISEGCLLKSDWVDPLI